ncbi:MFS transporter [Marinithermofilum abyssi]|uniref:MFS transporter n=1 Tax=Marinithermofilum abyssi TaxID=1571185 RepID=A0A8J2VC19_9BACL|nr:MFS transporter [Marinithermofilum abyssi]GGE18971.1 MFS transporter [Marinithermofilum abyssi]
MQILGKTHQLDRSAWLLLIISGLFATATALSNTFVNVYLWKIKHDFALIGWFNWINYLAMAVTFVFAGRMAKQVDRVIAIRLGVALQALFYLSVLMLGTHAADYVFFLGSFLGIGSGFFWLAYNVLYFEITERHNRDIFNGINGLLTSVAGIATPLLSGWVITRVDHFTGYRIIFGISLAVFLLAVVVTFLLRPRSAAGVYRLKEILSLVRNRDNYWYWVNLAMIAQGAREGLFVFLISLLVYVATGNELALGSYLTAASAVGLFSYFLVGRFMRLSWRDESILVGSLMMGIVVVPLIWDINTWTLVILGLGAALFYPVYMVPLTSAVFDVIGQSNETAQLRVEYVVARELALNLGRILSISAFLWWIQRSPDMTQLKWLVLAVGFIQVLTWVFIRRVPLLNK